ncbi:hypothetical protein Agabi119p4_2589 [Agaricus bisporus var. burnettii]|uniref:BTB domain-containing protein n=1 Tax=Agaricus bisporus var. burnettii TaxID=192524 RepID=A0A8H7KKF0_AGABI|nr:hypothetical protein Agabi119p4_2589 [Agaricus bisporus var. burnettii]
MPASDTLHTPPNLKSLKHHPVHYQPGGDLIVIIGDEAFRVPSDFFTRESKVFRDRLAEGSIVTNNSHDSTSKKSASMDNSPHTIVIQPEENVSSDDFAQLCSIFFNRRFSIYDNTLESWKTILRLANQWDFPEVKDLAFRELENATKFPIPLVERIVLYRKHKAEPRYLEPLYYSLLSRFEPLTEKEGEALELKLALQVNALREGILRVCNTIGEGGEASDKVKEAIRKGVNLLLGTALDAVASKESSGKAQSPASTLPSSGKKGLVFRR